MHAKSHFFGNTEKLAVEIGGTFSRSHELNIMETAEIVALCDDHSGVPHVRFNLISSLGPKVMDCGIKTLAVETFLQTYAPYVVSEDAGKPDRDRTGPRSNVTHLKSRN
jgi:hypothetical protein